MKSFILPQGKEALRDALNSLPKDKRWKVTVEEHKRVRTVEQNSRYWALLNDISEQVVIEGRNYSTEVWHEYFRTKFLGKDVFLVDGEMMPVTKSTRRLKIMEFADYMTKVEAWGAEHEVVFQEPEAA